jgi:hypothetical protein
VVELADNAPIEAVALLLAVPVVLDVLPPLDELLLFVEFPTDPAVPFAPAAARFPVALNAPVELLVCVLFAVAPRVDEADLLELAFNEPFAAKAFVVPLELEEFSAALLVTEPDLLEFSANAFVVEPDFVEFEEAEADSSNEDDFCPPDCCIRLLVELAVVEWLFSLELSSVRDASFVVEWLYVELMLDVDEFEDVLVSVLWTVSSVFAPREYFEMLASELLELSIMLVWFTFAPSLLPTVVRLPSYTFTPLATRASEEFTILTPLAPISTLPLIFTVAELFSVTVELLAATADCSSPAAVTLSIWLSRSGCFS